MNRLERLRYLGQELALLASFYDKGERFHEKYKKNREAFRLLITQRNSLARTIRTFQKGQLDRVNSLIDWNAYRAKDKQHLLYEDKWQKEEDMLRDILFDALEGAADIGFIYARDQIKRVVDVSPYDKKMQKILLKRATDSAKNTIDTTKERIVAKLSTDIDRQLKKAAFPLDIDVLVEEAITEVFDDLFRSKTIADNELLGGILDGALFFAREADITYKTWRTVDDPCPICESLDGERVGMDDVFEDDDGLEYDAPPDPHPNCRCFLDFES